MSSVEFSNYRPVAQDHFETHWYDLITDVVSTAWARISGTLHGPDQPSYFQKTNLFSQKVTIDPHYRDEKLDAVLGVSAPEDALASLNQFGNRVDDKATTIGLRYFQERHPGEFVYATELYAAMCQNRTQDDVDKMVSKLKQEAMPLTRYVFVPVFVEKRYLFGLIKLRHIAEVAVDLRNRHVIFYDPQVSDPHSLFVGNNIPLMNVIRQLGSDFLNPAEGEKLQIYTNTHKHQHEDHNCGVFTFVFLKRLLDSTGLVDLQAGQEFDYSQTIERDRALLHAELLDYAHEKFKPYAEAYEDNRHGDDRIMTWD